MGGLPRQTKRADLIRGLKRLGFHGPCRGGGKHPEFMVKDGLVVKLPNEHGPDIGLPLLKRILEQAGITPEEWDAI